MTPNKTQIQHFRISLGMAGLVANDAACDLILRVQSAMRKMGGDFDLETASKIECEVQEKYKTPVPGDK